MRDVRSNWQAILAAGFKSARELLHFLELPDSLAHVAAEAQFVTRVPRGFAALMEKGNPRDPLLLQVLAVPEELQVLDDFVSDPLQEEAYTVQPGLLHKYPGRVLLTVTGVCAIHCRYCFRREFPYAANNPGRAGWEQAWAYIKADTSIVEVIFSGGDPLLANNTLLAQLITAVEAIPHVRLLRIHTRVPVVLPERVDVGLVNLLAKTRLRCVVVLHANHARELSDNVANAVARLLASGCHVLNQSVLLSGVNDTEAALVALSLRLIACGILSYYLHCLDKVKGAAHFDVPDQDAYALHQALLAQLPGYLVPRLVRETPGGLHKMPVVY